MPLVHVPPDPRLRLTLLLGFGFGFLALVGATAGEATQAVGSLLLLGLLAAPAGAAIRLTDRPFHALALSAGLAVAEMWGGLLLSAEAPKLPPSFAIMATATAPAPTTATT
ncbi:metal ABC transporter permease [Kitasatospora sp. SUK 42]|uniref:metal ABC transporter permease n=1 Tax=Kitasatospora sp. SUK 42 TaxID=1588882 RepID=UPI0027E33E4D|nr:metal ABC transporter permease [Kitasatospora sp. SUK 42]